jgi:hypothetical protein
MARYTFEFKGVKTGDGFNETRQLKRVITGAEIATLLTTFSTEEGIEYLVVRKIAEPKPKPAPKEVKK